MPGDSGMTYSICWLKKTTNQEYSLAKLSFRNERELKTFLDKQKLKEFFLLLDMPYKKCWKEFLKLKWNDANE